MHMINSTAAARLGLQYYCGAVKIHYTCGAQLQGYYFGFEIPTRAQVYSGLYVRTTHRPDLGALAKHITSVMN